MSYFILFVRSKVLKYRTR